MNQLWRRIGSIAVVDVVVTARIDWDVMAADAAAKELSPAEAELAALSRGLNPVG